MSTRCRIGIQESEDKVLSIYCHNDGYLDGVGEVLDKNYNSFGKVVRLINLGDISRLGTEPVANPHAWEQVKMNPLNYSYANEWHRLHPDNTCDTYATRGEHCPAQLKTLKETIDDFLVSDQEYLYIFRDGKWWYITCRADDTTFINLHDNL